MISPKNGCNFYHPDPHSFCPPALVRRDRRRFRRDGKCAKGVFAAAASGSARLAAAVRPGAEERANHRGKADATRHYRSGGFALGRVGGCRPRRAQRHPLETLDRGRTHGERRARHRPADERPSGPCGVRGRARHAAEKTSSSRALAPKDYPQQSFKARSVEIDGTPRTGSSVTSATPVSWKSRPGVFSGFLLVRTNATTASTPREPHGRQSPQAR